MGTCRALCPINMSCGSWQWIGDMFARGMGWLSIPAKKHLNHGDDEIIWCGISMGYEDKNEVINSFVPDREKFDSFAKIIK